MNTVLLTHLTTLSLLSANPAPEPVGSVNRIDDSLDRLLAPEAKLERIAEGFEWAEGPVWDKENARLLFSDVPENTVYSWSEEEGLAVYLKPSGFTGPVSLSREPGSNGLAFDARGQLLSCEHGDRRLSTLTPSGGKMTLADNYEGKRFNSPNDLAVHSSGSLFFTDPPYGLPGGAQSEFKELDHQGVYRLDPDGSVTLLIADLPRPNGVTLSPDEKTLYIAQSHRPAPHILAYPINADLGLGKGSLLFDASDLAGQYAGSPDGLKCDREGNIWSTGPGGVLIITPDGKLLGHLLTGRRTANLAWGDDGKTLYLTADSDLLRIRTLVGGW
ncbi:MAG: SMP-30/gluconolactonase/LRE family protein [Verrucomicrobiota bacterium JB023]|nr:SMP-30/gluconolactonase/LRE family protein [Verrucomicrobiota bacterium JB023]